MDNKARRRKRYATDPEYRARRDAENARWWETHGAERRPSYQSSQNARRRERYANDPEYRARVDAETARYRAKNRAAIRERNRERYAADPETARARGREYARAHPRTAPRPNPERDRANSLRRRHGMDAADWARAWAEQDGLCYLCGDALTPGVPNGTAGLPVLDHIHDHCGPKRSCAACRRGIACSACNLLIGWARDDPARLLRVAERLTVANAAARERIAALPAELTLFD